MLHLQVFTDASVNTQSKVGYGAYLIVSAQSTSIDTLKDQVKIKRFAQTSSTKLELQTLLWSLEEALPLINQSETRLSIYTDSQNIISLPDRRADLEKNDYFTRKNKRLRHSELYQAFYRLTSPLSCELVKVVGHKASSQKNYIDSLFALVDKASRRALREEF